MAAQNEESRARFVFDVYSDGETIDGTDVINAIRALNLNPTIELVNSLGGTDKRGERTFTFDEFFKVFEAVRDNKDMGGYYDFVACLKTYDVGEDGKMKQDDLSLMLLTLGERMTKNELDAVMKDCALEEEDDEGWWPYMPFLARMCEKPVPKDIEPM